MAPDPDRLFHLLPPFYRLRDAEEGGPLQALLRVVGEQFDLVEEDVRRLYDNQFIETCEDWVVPYLGELIGYQPVATAGAPRDQATAAGRRRNLALFPRREIAGTLGFRARKGTLALLEQLAADVAGWPARAVEFYRRLLVTQHANFLRPDRRLLSRRDPGALALLGGPFDRAAYTADVRRADSRRTRGLHNVPAVGVFLWRLRAYSVTRTPAFAREDEGEGLYSFSILGNDAPLFVRPVPEPDASHIAEEVNLPARLRREALRDDPAAFYRPARTLLIWRGEEEDAGPTELNAVPLDRVRVADLTGWRYEVPEGMVAVDPVLGRLAFSREMLPAGDVWVTYHYGFSADIGGGEYPRVLAQPPDATVYRVSRAGGSGALRAALDKWAREKPRHAVIELVDGGVFDEAPSIELAAGQRLQIQAASRTRPVLRLYERRPSRSDALRIRGEPGSRFVLDGLLVSEHGLRLEGDIECVTIRHSTLVPGWSLNCDCSPCDPTEPSILTRDFRGRLSIEHSIVGALAINGDEVRREPVAVSIRDSIVDATSVERSAIAAQANAVTHAVLDIRRSTVIGRIRAHAIDLGENAIFLGEVVVLRSQRGCVRFSFVAPGSRTPRRYHCQPDLVEQAAAGPGDALRERNRVTPQFTSTRYGNPGYGQLADRCADEITRGADDESEMGVFHDLFQPQREVGLRARLEEHVPASTNVALIHAT
jgi:hypothetical protein